MAFALSRFLRLGSEGSEGVRKRILDFPAFFAGSAEKEVLHAATSFTSPATFGWLLFVSDNVSVKLLFVTDGHKEYVL